MELALWLRVLKIKTTQLISQSHFQISVPNVSTYSSICLFWFDFQKPFTLNRFQGSFQIRPNEIQRISSNQTYLSMLIQVQSIFAKSTVSNAEPALRNVNAKKDKCIIKEGGSKEIFLFFEFQVAIFETNFKTKCYSFNSLT